MHVFVIAIYIHCYIVILPFFFLPLTFWPQVFQNTLLRESLHIHKRQRTLAFISFLSFKPSSLL